MATGILGSTVLSASAYSIVYTCPAGFIASANVTICNQSASGIGVRLAVEASSTSAPTQRAFIEYGAAIAGNTPLERTGLVLAAGQTIMAWVDATSAASCVVMGFEESA